MGVCHMNNQFLQWNPIFVFRLLQVSFFLPSLHMLVCPTNVSDLNKLSLWLLTEGQATLMLVTDVEGKFSVESNLPKAIDFSSSFLRSISCFFCFSSKNI